MDCDLAQEMLSARLDGELPVDANRAVQAHVETCPRCARWLAQAEVLHRRTVVRPAEAVPDLVPAIMSRSGAPSVGRGEWVRLALSVVAATLLVLSVPVLLFGSEPGTPDHEGRHLGAFGVALAAGFLYSAWKPERAIGLVPFAAVLGVALAVTAVVDVAGGRSSAAAESHHLVELAGVVLLWTLAGGPRQLGRRLRAGRPFLARRPSIRPVHNGRA